MEKEKGVFSKIGLAIALTTIVVGLIQGVLIAVSMSLMPSLTSNPWFSYLLLLVFYFIGLPMFFALVKEIPNSPRNEKKKLSVKEILILFFITYAAMIITNLATVYLMKLVALIKGSSVTNPLLNMLDKSSLLGTFLFAGIFSPIVEETLFRGIMLNKLKCYGDKVAIITTAVLFGLFHANFSQFFYAVAIGLIFAYVAIKTGTIKYTIILHMMINIMGSVIPILTSRSSITQVVFNCVVVLFVILGIVFFFTKRKNISLSPAEVQIEEGHVFKVTCVNFGMIFNFIISSLCMVSFLLK